MGREQLSMVDECSERVDQHDAAIATLVKSLRALVRGPAADTSRPIGLQSDLDRADAARAIRFKLRRIAKRRHMAAAVVAIDEGQQRVALLEDVRFAVDESGEIGEILDHGVEWLELS